MVPVHVLPDIYNFSLQIIATFILFLVLRHFLFEPVSKFLNERKEKIASDIDAAQQEKEEAVKLKEDYEAKIEEAKDEARDIVDSAKKRGEELREEIITEARKEANDIKEKAHKEIEREKEKAIDDLKSEVVTVAMMAASKVVNKNLDENDHREMINNVINEVGESKWQN